MTEEIYDALILSVDSLMESWILDSRASFHSTSYKENMQNYIAGNFGKVYLVDDELLKICGEGWCLAKDNKWDYVKVEECKTYS